MSFKAKLFWSASAFMFAVASVPAHAQDAANPIPSEDQPVPPPPGQEEDQPAPEPSDQPDERAPEAADEIIVTGIRASMTEALEVKRESAQIVDAIVAEDIGKLPDNNVVDALQRVSGVQVTDRTGGEATSVTIRGLPDIATRWNGREIFTAAGRQFALQDIPANLVRRIEVYKTRAPEHIESGLAGQIDVFTHRPLDFTGFAFSAGARGIYHEQADTFNPNVSALLSNRWETGIGDIGALVNVSYSRTRYRDQSVTAGAMVPFATPDNPPPGFVPLQRFFSNWQPGLDEGLPMEPGSTLTFNGAEFPYLLARDALFAADTQGDRERPAVNAALQWAPDDRSQYTFEFFWDGYRNDIFNNLHFTFADWWGFVGRDPASTITLFPDTNVIRTRSIDFPFGFNSGDMLRDQTDSYVYALEGKWQIGDRLNVKSDLAYQQSRFKSKFMAMRTVRVARALDLDFNAGDGVPSWEFLREDETGNLVSGNDLMTDPAQWGVGELYDNAARSEGKAWTLTTDAKYDVDGPFLRTLGFGIRYDDRRAGSSSRDQSTGWLGWVPQFANMPEGLWHVNEDFFDGRADVPSSWVVPDGRYLVDHADEIRQMYIDAGYTHLQLADELELERNFRVREYTSAGYLQGDFESDVWGRPLRIQAGVRLVNFRTPFTFFDQVTGEPTDGSQETTEFLPSASARYDVTRDLRLRFAYGETIRRPAFGSLNPTLNLGDDLTNVGYAVGSGGNPDLQPTRSKNYDLAVEWYFQNDSALYATVFRREIDGLVVPLRRVMIIDDHDRHNPSNIFIVTQPVNASEGLLRGVELGFVYFPTLPGILNGLGAQGSFTWLDSKQNIPNTNEVGEIIGEMTSPFFLVSDKSYNVTLAYERGRLGTRLSYVWRDEFLHHNEARLFANPIGVWNRPERSLDFQLTYNVTDSLAATLDATNITDDIRHSYYRFRDVGSPEVTNFGNWIVGRTFAVGLRYRID